MKKKIERASWLIFLGKMFCKFFKNIGLFVCVIVKETITSNIKI